MKVTPDKDKKGRPRVFTELKEKEIVNLRAKIGLLSVEPSAHNIAGVVCAYMDADICNLLTSDIVTRGMDFLNLLYKKYDPKILQSFNFAGELGNAPPKTLSIPHSKGSSDEQTQT